ncbi:MAG: zinc ribbon domain-containing protein [Promethearchaeia archaeon]
MSTTSDALQRCPRCGNKNRANSYACTFCGKRLRTESIEKLPIFKRFEAKEWTHPLPWYRKIYNLFVNPSKAFWDINHKRSKAPGMLILLFNALLYGLFGLAIFSHFKIVAIGDNPINPFSLYLFSYNLSFFLSFFLFGLVYYAVFFTLLTWLFTKGANYAVDFSGRLESRFGSSKEGPKYSQEQVSVFSIYKGGTLLQKQESHKYKMLFSAFAPFLLINAIKVIITLFAFPNVELTVNWQEFNLETYQLFFNSPIWIVFDVLDALIIALWIPILISIGIRELSNSSTYRVFISSLIIGIAVAFIYYLFRPHLLGSALL